MSHGLRHLVLSLGLLVPTGFALAQSAASGPAPGPRVEQGIADVGPLNTSLRQPPADLRVDNDWQDVYRAPHGSSLLMRQAGGLTAVFPQSDYAMTMTGTVFPVVPGGTVFYIGMPPEPFEVARKRRQAELGSMGPPGPATEPAHTMPAVIPLQTVDNEVYRRNLLWRIADREMARLECEPGG